MGVIVQKFGRARCRGVATILARARTAVPAKVTLRIALRGFDLALEQLHLIFRERIGSLVEIIFRVIRRA